MEISIQLHASLIRSLTSLSFVSGALCSVYARVRDDEVRNGARALHFTYKRALGTPAHARPRHSLRRHYARCELTELTECSPLHTCVPSVCQKSLCRRSVLVCHSIGNFQYFHSHMKERRFACERSEIARRQCLRMNLYYEGNCRRRNFYSKST